MTLAVGDGGKRRRLCLPCRLCSALAGGPSPAGRQQSIIAIACGYEDANDLDRLRFDPAFKLACGRLPDSGLDLCSQPTCSRLENLPDLRSVMRLGGVLVDLWLSSYAAPPENITLDIDDTVDVGLCCKNSVDGRKSADNFQRDF